MRTIALAFAAAVLLGCAAASSVERPAYMMLLDDTDKCVVPLANGTDMSTENIPHIYEVFEDNVEGIATSYNFVLSACTPVSNFTVNDVVCPQETAAYATIYESGRATCNTALYFTSMATELGTLDGEPVVIASYNTSETAAVHREIKATFVCDENAEVPIQVGNTTITAESDEPVEWAFVFQTKEVCAATSGGSGGKKLSTGAIIGITAGGVAVVGGGAFAFAKLRGGSSAPEGEYSRV